MQSTWHFPRTPERFRIVIGGFLFNAHLANRHCIVRTGNPVSYHLIVHLKAKGTATLWPDKVAVLQAWSRKGRSLGFFPLG